MESDLVLNITQSSDSFNAKKKRKINKRKNVLENERNESRHELNLEENNINDKKNSFKSSSNFSRGSSSGYRNNDNNNDSSHSFTSSLFRNNPEIPHINLSKVKSREEQVFSHHSFDEINLHPHLVSCLRDRLSITETTIVQQKSIPILMKGYDALIKSVTGSGKTLAYAVPIMNSLQRIQPKISRSDGVYCLILVPTRELAIQSFECFTQLSRAFTWIVPGCLMGGEKKKSEKARIRKGINVLITTPGRLLDHIDNTNNLHLNRVQWFVIDEADRLLEQGFEEAAAKIVEHLKDACEYKPQTVLLSATLSKGVERLAGMSLIDPQVIDMSDQDMKIDSYTLPQNLQQHYMFVPAKLRLITLSAFIIKHCSSGKMKALVFLSAQDVVDFYHLIFNNVFKPILENSKIKELEFFRLHGNMEQHDRVKVFQHFKNIHSGLLFCTDVAARGLDLPQVDWIIQFNCSSKPEDYVHRVGRTARIGTTGNALQFLLPSEHKFLEDLQEHLQINLNEINVQEILKSILLLKFERRIVNPEEFSTHLQMIFENSIYEDNDLLELAKKAYLSYIRAYASYPRSTQKTLPFRELHLGHIAKSFCLRESPKALGANGYRLKQQSLQLHHAYTHNEPPVKRKYFPLEMKISEFDSGLDSRQKPPRKKFKK